MEKQNSFLHHSSSPCVRIFVDGASRHNPGPAGAGIYITHTDETLCKVGYYLGNKTNNQAEYLAVLIALLIVQPELNKRQLTNPHFVITSDSQLLVRQMSGQYRVKNPGIAQIKRVIDELLRNRSYEFRHVLRENNTMADKLANHGINTKKKLPSSYRTLLAEHDLDL